VCTSFVAPGGSLLEFYLPWDDASGGVAFDVYGQLFNYTPAPPGGTVVLKGPLHTSRSDTIPMLGGPFALQFTGIGVALERGARYAFCLLTVGTDAMGATVNPNRPGSQANNYWQPGLPGNVADYIFDKGSSFTSSYDPTVSDKLAYTADAASVSYVAVFSPSQLLSVAGPTTVVGDVTLGPSSVLTVGAATGGVLHVVNGTVVILPGATAVVAGSVSGTVTVVTATGGIVGTFSSVTGTGCSQVTAVNYASSSVSVVVSVPDSCSALSTGALVGIVVGSVCGGLLVALAIVLVSRWLVNKRDTQSNREIKAVALSEVKAAKQGGAAQLASE
jgi:hypothetical protein